MKTANRGCLSASGKLQIAIQRNRRRLQQQPDDTYTPVVLFPSKPLSTLKACVIVPVKNEQDHIVRTLDALRNQQDAKGQPLLFEEYEILLLANNCTDRTAHTANMYAKQHPQLQLHIACIQLSPAQAHIGTARRLLMDEAFRRHSINKHDGIILSTDGDTEVDRQWIYHTMLEMSSGCSAVGGRILTRTRDEDSKRYYLQDITYRCLCAQLEAQIDPGGYAPGTRHFQYFGASLAVRCSAYHKAGRLPVIPFLEDEAFSRALHRVDVRMKKSALVKVYTSARLQGRVEAGLSVHLRHLGNLQKQCVALYVEPVAALAEKWSLKNSLRNCWDRQRKGLPFAAGLGTAAGTIGAPASWLKHEMDIARYFGEWWEKAEERLSDNGWHHRYPGVKIEDAIRELRSRLTNRD